MLYDASILNVDRRTSGSTVNAFLGNSNYLTVPDCYSLFWQLHFSKKPVQACKSISHHYLNALECVFLQTIILVPT